MEDGGSAGGHYDGLDSSVISIWLTRTVWIRGGPGCPRSADVGNRAQHLADKHMNM